MIYLGNQAVGLNTNTLPINRITPSNIKALIAHTQEYIVTDYYPSSDKLIKIDLSVGERTASYQHMAGAAIGNDTCIRFQYPAGNTAIANIILKSYSVSTETLQGDSVINKRIIYTFQGSCVAADSQAGAIQVADRPLVFFGGYFQGNIESMHGQGILYGTLVINAQTMIVEHEFVPFLDDNDTPCLKDLMTNQLYYNSGTGAFGYIDLENVVHDA